MIYTPSTRLFRTTNHNVAQGAVVYDEGMALVASSNGTVRPASGTKGERFVGVSLFQRGALLTFPKFIDATPTAQEKTFPLYDKPLGGTLKIRNATTNKALVADTDYTFDDATNSVTFKDTQLDTAVVIAFEFSPTQMQARATQGDILPGGTVPQNYSVVGVLEVGTLFTSHFEVADDWTDASLPVRLGANGKFTTSGDGETINAWVVNVPCPAHPYLGLEIK